MKEWFVENLFVASIYSIAELEIMIIINEIIIMKFPLAPKIWELIPRDIRSANSLAIFK